MDWFRCYTELPDEPKLEDMPPIASWFWVVIMCLANKSPRRGYLLMGEGVPYTLKSVARKARIRYDHARNFYERFTILLMIEVVDLDGQPTMHLTNHNKRQYISDDSTPRVQKHRAGNVSETLLKQKCNDYVTPPDTDTDTDTDTEDLKPNTSGDSDEPNLAILAVLKNINGYPFDPAADIKYLVTIAGEFQTLDLLATAKAWAVYKLDKPLEKKSNPRSQFRRWCQFELEKLKKGGNGNGRGKANIGSGTGSATGCGEMEEWEKRIYS